MAGHATLGQFLTKMRACWVIHEHLAYPGNAARSASRTTNNSPFATPWMQIETFRLRLTNGTPQSCPFIAPKNLSREQLPPRLPQSLNIQNP